MKNRVEIKAEARALIRSGVASPLLVSAILIAVQIFLSELTTFLESGTFSFLQIMEIMKNGEYPPLLAASTEEIPVYASFVAILCSLVITVLTAGYYAYCMGIRRGLEMPVSTLLDGLGIAGKVIWCSILMSIKTFLWSLLFVIPGIVAIYRYRFAMYNLITDNSLSASEAIALSCRQTEGMKMDLFVLDLSFIGWELLSLLTFGILDIWRFPYLILSDLGYYEQAQIRMGASTPGNAPPPWEP